MTIFNNDEKFIKLRFNNSIQHSIDEEKKSCYTINMPTVICSDKKDAETVQKIINSVINNLCKEIINK